jgi:hypothetical protein
MSWPNDATPQNSDGFSEQAQENPPDTVARKTQAGFRFRNFSTNSQHSSQQQDASLKKPNLRTVRIVKVCAL